MKLKNLFIIIFSVLMITLSGAEIKVKTKLKKLPVFNSKNNKMYNYYILAPGEEITFESISTDKVDLFTRLLDSKGVYTYKLKYNKINKNITKKAKTSNSSKTVDGKTVSAYNKVSVKKLNKKRTSFTIVNTSKKSILLKPSCNRQVKSSKKIDYISFMPEKYEKEKILKVNEDTYSYFTEKEDTNGITLSLEGPVYLKIMSRLVLNNNLKRKSGYIYKVYNNGTLLSEIREKTVKSYNSSLVEEEDKSISKGDVNIIKLPEGVNRVRIEGADKKKELLYRLFISKSAVKVSTL